MQGHDRWVEGIQCCFGLGLVFSNDKCIHDFLSKISAHISSSTGDVDDHLSEFTRRVMLGLGLGLGNECDGEDMIMILE